MTTNGTRKEVGYQVRWPYEDKFSYFPTVEECADAAVLIFAANRWRWTRCGVPNRAQIVETLNMLRDTLPEGYQYQGSGHLIYDSKRGYGHELPRVKEPADE